MGRLGRLPPSITRLCQDRQMKSRIVCRCSRRMSGSIWSAAKLRTLLATPNWPSRIAYLLTRVQIILACSENELLPFPHIISTYKRFLRVSAIQISSFSPQSIKQARNFNQTSPKFKFSSLQSQRSRITLNA